jgi:hypothetical protein
VPFPPPINVNYYISCRREDFWTIDFIRREAFFFFYSNIGSKRHTQKSFAYVHSVETSHGETPRTSHRETPRSNKNSYAKNTKDSGP